MIQLSHVVGQWLYLFSFFLKSSMMLNTILTYIILFQKKIGEIFVLRALEK